jgi:hypothetical protein
MTSKIMYVDESKTKDGSFMAVTGLILDSDNSVQLVHKIEKICKNYIKEGFSLIDKKNCLKQLRQTSSNDKNNPFSNLTVEERKKFTTELYSLLEEFNCKIVSCLIKKKFFRNQFYNRKIFL